MLAPRLFNERRLTPAQPVFGCVTNGAVWQFLKLDQGQLSIDSEQCFINQVDKILGILTTIMQPPPRSLQLRQLDRFDSSLLEKR